MRILQHSLNQNTYNYWQAVEDQRKASGSIFDPPPARIDGNVFAEDANTLPALGIFEVSAVTALNFPIRRFDVPYTVQQQFPGCTGGNGVPPPECFNCLALRNSSNTPPDFWE